MNVLRQLRSRIRPVLDRLGVDGQRYLETVRPAQDARFGDYQANCAMPLGKQLGRPPREVAQRIVAELDVADLCQRPEIAGPGFINLRLRDSWISEQLAGMLRDERLGVEREAATRTFVIDYSSPNVAKPMHVGHIRSTVIGDAICRTLRFVGHRVISDNHLGDWGTQFGMIIYGYKHFVDRRAYQEQPVQELARLYRLVSQLVDYEQACQEQLPQLQQQLARRREQLAEQEAAVAAAGTAPDKAVRKRLAGQRARLEALQAELRAVEESVERVRKDPVLGPLAKEHAGIRQAVLEETARLHAGDEQNVQLWREFLPHCRQEIQRIYDRLGIRFDVEYGESFYQQRLEGVVNDLLARGLATESDGAICVFVEGFDTPMIVRKKDGAFLYATTDLATIQYRMQQWNPDAILYVVDHRQSEHFAKLFDVARRWGYDRVDLRHISFGTVLGEDGKPFRTRSGETVGLEGLLDEAVERAYRVVCQNDDQKPAGPELSDDERRRIATVVGHAAIKYADLSHNRTSDYVFSYDKMVAMEGNTATYMQYCYARTQSIFARGGVDVAQLRQAGAAVHLDHPAERALAVELLRFHEALDESLDDYRPNQLTAYLYRLATQFSKFYEQCSVLRADQERTRISRLLLCDLTGRTIRQGLQLLGIDVVDKM